MKVQVKRSLITVLLGASLLMMAGCGTQNVMDTYSFGNQVIHSGKSEITIALPYEMGKSPQSESNDGYPMDLYGANSAHIMIQVQALQALPNKPLPTVDDYVKGRESEFASLAATITTEQIDLNGVPATKITGTFPGQNRQNSISQYVFINEGVLWNITYVYPTDDQVGADISKEIQNKIYVTQKKEG